ncbi:Uncharacterised protein [Mycobacterium tuberculosis]|nr:Uncharacterised protein [Mycobacterium tuberculosis]CNU86883.1 Uncharacterised protein [Mycobacterium tuberculosis]
MSLQCGAHRRDLILVVVEFRIEAAASQPAEDGNQVYRHLAPSGGEFVEHLPGIFDRGARNPVQAGTKSCGRQHLRLHQPGRFVLRSKDPIFGARQRQQRSAADELGEIALVLCHRGIAPLLAQFGHLGRLAGHHPRAPGIGTQDATLLTLAGMVGIPTREQCGHLARPAAIGGRQPDHPNRHDRTVLARLRAGCEAGLELLDQCRQRRRRSVARWQLQYVELRVRMACTLLAQPAHDQLHLDRRRRGSQHQCVLGSKHRAGIGRRFGHDRPLALELGDAEASPSLPAILDSLGLAFGDAFFVAAFVAAAPLLAALLAGAFLAGTLFAVALAT